MTTLKQFAAVNLVSDYDRIYVCARMNISDIPFVVIDMMDRFQVEYNCTYADDLQFSFQELDLKYDENGDKIYYVIIPLEDERMNLLDVEYDDDIDW